MFLAMRRVFEDFLKNNFRKTGSIVFGGGLNAEAWIEEAKSKGYFVIVRDGYAELYEPVKKQ